jgi:AraC family transcriptional regulator
MEITLAIRRSPDSYVSRKGAGIQQHPRVQCGTLWLCPVAVGEDDISISAPLDEILHISPPAERFETSSALYGDGRIRAAAVGYLAGVEDPLIRQIGLTIHQELINAGRSADQGAFQDQIAIPMETNVIRLHRSIGIVCVSPRY